MKKIYYSLLAVLSCGMIASCQQDELEFVDSKLDSNVKLTATIENDFASRTQLGATEGGYKTLWSEGDALSVFNSSTTHAKFVLDSKDAGKVDASFVLKEGSLSIGTEDSNNSFGVLGVYPYSASTTVSKSADVYTINTVIPVEQEYAVNSFGYSASPMVGVHPMSYNLFLKNVGTVLVMPLKDNPTYKDATIIKAATLQSKSGKNIAGATVVTVADGENPVAEVSAELGSSWIELTCGNGGVELSKTEATKFFFVLTPGKYEPKDLVVRFYDGFGNYFETEIAPAEPFELQRSYTHTFNERVFKIDGQKTMNCYVTAQASAYMHAERILPSLKSVKEVGTWAKELKDKPNTKALVEEAITYISLKEYKAAYDVLNGIPGFVRDIKEFNATGTFTQPVQYSQLGYLVSMLDDIEKIEDIESLLKFIKDFENLYIASGLSTKLDESLDLFSDGIDTFISEFTNVLGKFGITLPEGVVKGLLNKALGDLKEMSLVESLEKTLAEPNSLTSKFFNYLFSQEKIMDTVKATLRTIVTDIEEATKNEVNAGNSDEKNKAINTAKTTALINARALAAQEINDDFVLTNQTNIDNLYAGPWGIFQQILNNGNCIDAFNKLDLLEVYDALVKLGKVVEEMITYEKGRIYYYIAELEDYQENVDWWVIEGAPSEE